MALKRPRRAAAALGSPESVAAAAFATDAIEAAPSDRAIAHTLRLDGRQKERIMELANARSGELVDGEWPESVPTALIAAASEAPTCRTAPAIELVQAFICTRVSVKPNATHFLVTTSCDTPLGPISARASSSGLLMPRRSAGATRAGSLSCMPTRRVSRPAGEADQLPWGRGGRPCASRRAGHAQECLYHPWPERRGSIRRG